MVVVCQLFTAHLPLVFPPVWTYLYLGVIKYLNRLLLQNFLQEPELVEATASAI